MNEEKIQSPTNFECPNCGNMFGEDDLMELCSEPFNGTIVECPECKKEFDCNILISIIEIEK